MRNQSNSTISTGGRLLSLLLIAAFALSACGGAATATSEVPTAAPAQPTEAPTAESAAPATAAPAPTIKIGVLNPTSGNFAIFGDQVNSGIKLYFDSIDYQVDGTQVEVIYADTAFDPQQALEQARRLVEQEKVDLLMGLVNSAVSVPLAQYADEAKVPLLITVAGARAPTGPDRSPYVFRSGAANGQEDRPLGWYVASKLGLTRAATFAWDFLAGEEHANDFIDTFTAAGGTVVSQQKPPLGTSDYGPFISKVDPADIDVAYAFFAGPAAISFVQQMRQFGFTPDVTLAAPGFFTAGVLEAMGTDAEGLIQAAEYAPVLDTAENRLFLERYDASIGGEPGVYVEEGYLGAMVVAQAVAAAGDAVGDTEALLQALASVDFDGPSGRITFDDNGQSVRTIYIIRVVQGDDGKVVQQVLEAIPDVSQDWTP